MPVANEMGRGFISTGNPGNKVIVFDLETLKATGAVATGQNPKPAFSQTDGKGHVYANIENKEDKQEIVEIAVKDSVVSKR